MTDQRCHSVDRQERLHEILLAYVEAAEDGAAPDRQTFVAAYPEFAADIAEFLTSYEHINQMTAPLREVDGVSRPLDVDHWRTRVPRAADLVPEAAGVTEALERGGDLSPSTGELGQLGDYRLLREIGRGGMGVVYEAEQISLRRRVALKVLPFAAGVDSRQLQRFRNEAEAAAHLHHSHIVPVFAVGSERGVHYYAMQFIEGHSLATLIAELRAQQPPLEATSDSSSTGTAAPTTQALAALTTEHTTRSRRFYHTIARLGHEAAEALEHAHQLGIVHRDIKPANLLLDGRGHLWITDFGLAQFHSQVGLTMTGELLGTLRYVSPEQAMAKRGLVDHRSDLYSLGATLYEAVTLEPVYPGRDRHALLQQIGFDEPRPPRSLDPKIPVELETIVLKALAKNPADRYGTAQELADDLQRFLDDKPILARRPRLWERGRKWLRRHPSVVVSGILLLVLLATASLISAWFILSEQRKTQLAYERERQRAEEAEDRFQLVRQSVEEMVQLAEQELIDQPHLQGLRKLILESALPYYQKLIEQRRDAPEAQAELAAARDRVKKILTDLAVLQGSYSVLFLNSASVLDDLRATEEQREELADLLRRDAEQRQKSFRQFHKLSAEERRATFLELARSTDTDLGAILSAKQLRRLRQIGLQARGLMALCEPDIAAALKLTTEQRERIRRIEMEAFFGKDRPPFGPVFAPKGKVGPPKKTLEHTVASVNEKVQTILTARQLTQWNEMIGPAFKGKLGFRPLGPPVPPPR